MLKKDTKRIENIIALHLEQHDYVLKQGEAIPKFDKLIEEVTIIYFLEKYGKNISPEKKTYYEEKLKYMDLGVARRFYKWAKPFFK